MTAPANLLKFLSALLLSLLLGLLLAACGRSNSVRVDAIHVSGDRFSGDAYVIRFPDGQTHLIDTGFGQFTRSDLIPFLQAEKIERIDRVLVTHAHRNHYEGLPGIADVVEIGEVFFNLPNRAACSRETWSTGCNYAHVLKTRKMLADRDVPVKPVTANQVLYQDTERGILFETLYLLGGQTMAVTGMSTNDESVVARLSVGGRSMLFTGDIGPKAGDYLLQQGADLHTDILTLPHHGVNATVPDEFIRKSQASYAIASNSAGHWLGERGERLRKLTEALGMSTYNTGLHGNIHIQLAPETITIASDRSAE